MNNLAAIINLAAPVHLQLLIGRQIVIINDVPGTSVLGEIIIVRVELDRGVRDQINDRIVVDLLKLSNLNLAAALGLPMIFTSEAVVSGVVLINLRVNNHLHLLYLG
jgi:hypothetical protein